MLSFRANDFLRFSFLSVRYKHAHFLMQFNGNFFFFGNFDFYFFFNFWPDCLNSSDFFFFHLKFVQEKARHTKNCACVLRIQNCDYEWFHGTLFVFKALIVRMCLRFNVIRCFFSSVFFIFGDCMQIAHLRIWQTSNRLLLLLFPFFFFWIICLRTRKRKKN